MNMRIRSLGAVLLGLLFGLSFAVSAEAQLSKADQKCRDAIAKNFAKAVSSADKVSSGCHKGRNSGKIPNTTNCNDLSPGQADAKLKFQKAQGKLDSAVTKSCIDAGASPILIDGFKSCPEPCATETLVPNPMTTYAHVADCLACLAGDIVERRNRAADGHVLGSPTAPMALKATESCHSAIAKNYGKHLNTLIKERQACQKAQDKLANNELQPCDTSDTKGKIAAAAVKANAAVEDKCAGVNLTLVDSCSSTDVTSLNACLLAENNARGSEGFSSGYELPPTICPSRIDSLVLAGTGISGASRTLLQVGWKSNVHDADLVDRYFLSTDLGCPVSPPCGDCTVDGISPNGPQYNTFARCVTDFSQRCDEPFGPDVDDCGGADCVYILGPPLPISAANNPTCSINILTQDVTGTANPETGGAELNVELRTRVFLGVEITQPCPVCANDPTPQDGNTDGICQGGLLSGSPCDVDGWDASFAKQADNKGLSLDCPQDNGQNISGAGILIPLEFTTGHTQLDYENACDSPLGAQDCACGVCSLNQAFPCRNDGECAAITAGTCTSKGGGENRRPNDCTGFLCTDLGNEQGECTNVNDKAEYCDGILAEKANGNPFVSCDVNGQSDCDGTDCGGGPGSCGDCTLEVQKRCFLNPIEADGDPDLENPLLVSTFCIPPTNSVAINSTGGLPGPARVFADMLVDQIF